MEIESYFDCARRAIMVGPSREIFLGDEGGDVAGKSAGEKVVWMDSLVEIEKRPRHFLRNIFEDIFDGGYLQIRCISISKSFIIGRDFWLTKINICDQTKCQTLGWFPILACFFFLE